MDYQRIIKDYMKVNHISYADLGAALGVTRQRVWTLLNTKSSVRLETLEKIASVLGLELALY